jgi:HAD superfamily hydrolase (TIGR01509 family)
MPARAVSVIDAVILDMDGLMLDTEPVSERCWKAAAREAGHDIDDALFARMIGRTMAEDHRLLRERFGAAFPAETVGARARVLFHDLLETEGVARKPGLLDLLARLDARAVPRAVATSAALDGARRQLARAGVLDRVHAVAAGDEVRAGKPAPDVFLLAAERLGVAPARCAVLEDSGPGIHAARAAGMTAILVPDRVAPHPDVRAAAHVVVASLHEARTVLDGLLDARTD